jgi:acyl-CoA reductase-like NAD-dependent aldehyde dehydrogenase
MPGRVAYRFHRPVYKEFTDRFLAEVKKLKVGDPLDETVDVGPMISEKEAERAESWIQEAQDNGARLLCGGNRERAVLAPTVLAEVSPEMRVSCQEVFAPVVILNSYEDFD